MQARAWLSWTCVGLLAALCVLLAFLQNRWINEFTLAEQQRLHSELTAKLNNLSRDFNENLGTATLAFLPSPDDIERLGREKAYSAQYVRSRELYGSMFKRIAFAVPQDKSVQLFNLDPQTGSFSRSDWPTNWQPVRDSLRDLFAPNGFSNIIVIPRFEDSPNNGPGPPAAFAAEWLLAEVDLNYVRTTMLPNLLRAHLGNDGWLDYQVEIAADVDPSNVISRYGEDPQVQIGRDSDASVTLFDANPTLFARDRNPPPEGRRPPPEDRRGPGMRAPPPRAPPNFARGRWRMLVRHKDGSLEAAGARARARKQNLAISLGILFLILATATALLRFSRRAQQLAEAQINFVAGVSHELKTPLTVIRTAAFNLRGALAHKPDQVERYGQLIHEQSRRLASLVDQILHFASSEAGHVIRERASVAPATVIEDALRASLASVDDPELIVDKQLSSDLPPILADEQALRQALQNLMENALKYGIEQSNWIGIFASAVTDAHGSAVEIRVADRGPGIPRDEQTRIFDPFFRGRLAARNQIHGAGLGLNLVKKIVEAHGGALRVISEPFERTEFIITIPAAPAERKHELQHSIG